MLLYIVHCRLIDLRSLIVSSDYRVSWPAPEMVEHLLNDY